MINVCPLIFRYEGQIFQTVGWLYQLYPHISYLDNIFEYMWWLKHHFHHEYVGVVSACPQSRFSSPDQVMDVHSTRYPLTMNKKIALATCLKANWAPIEQLLRKMSRMGDIPSGKLSHHNYGKSPFLMGKLTINGHVQ